METIHHTKRCIEYNMTVGRLTLHTRRHNNRCDKCDIPIEVGDRIVRCYRSSGGTRLLHKECAEELNII